MKKEKQVTSTEIFANNPSIDHLPQHPSYYTINILGVPYKVYIRSVEEDERLVNYDGYCDWTTRTIVISDCADKEDMGDVGAFIGHVLMHEITHACMHESGMDDYSDDEKIVEWVACMVEKIHDSASEAMRLGREWLLCARGITI